MKVVVHKRFFSIILILLMIFAVTTGYFLYQRFVGSSELTFNRNKTSAMEAAETIEKVSKLIILPENEIPTVATISNLEPLQGQQFFARAEVGDKVLIYSVSGKGILYRPDTNMIIEVAPIDFTP